MSDLHPWEEQWKRVGRWFERFEATTRGRVHDRNSDAYQDEVYSFFQNCYHLKDWLKNDEASRTAAADVEQLIKKSPALSLCADLANGSKHLTLDKPRVDAATKIGERRYALLVGGPSQRIAVGYAVEAAGKKRSAGQDDLTASVIARRSSSGSARMTSPPGRFSRRASVTSVGRNLSSSDNAGSCQSSGGRKGV